MEARVKARRGRPANTVHGTLSGGNPTTGESIAWSDGLWHGTKRLVAAANYLCVTGEVLPVPGTDAFIVATGEDPVAAYAIIADLVGPRGIVEGDLPVEDLAVVAALAVLDPDEFEGVA